MNIQPKSIWNNVLTFFIVSFLVLTLFASCPMFTFAVGFFYSLRGK